MSRTFLVACGCLVAMALIAGPVAYAFHQQAQMRNFRIVRAGVLYRSGQMTVEGLRRAVHDYGIRTVITLRDPLDGPAGEADRAEEEFCRREEIQYLRLPPQVWDLQDDQTPIAANVERFRRTLADPRNYPVLLHCYAGIHRTGAYCAIYRMEQERWDNARAIAEVKACGYDTFDWDLDVAEYLEKYRPTWAPARSER